MIPVLDELLELLGKKNPADVRVALIPNSKDYYAKRAYDFKVNRYVEYMKGIGFSPELVDLREHDRVSLEATLSEYNLIWAMGGNTFNLRYEMKRSGFDEIIRPLLEKGIVYGGDSAGAMVVGPTLEGVGWADEPEFAEEQINDGVGVTKYIIIPHADSHSFGDAIQKIRDLHKDKKDVVILNDNQAFVINGSKTKVVASASAD
jgi:dipeptidase E